MDSSNNTIAKGFASAKGEWMTDDFVAFEGTLEFRKPAKGEKGTLILRKHNPNDLPQFDDSLEIPVFFK